MSEPLLNLLGDCDSRKAGRRSPGRSAEAVSAVLANQALFPELFAGFFHSDSVVRMRTADAVEKVTRAHPRLLDRWKPAILGPLSQLQENEVRWHIAQMIPRL